MVLRFVHNTTPNTITIMKPPRYPDNLFVNLDDYTDTYIGSYEQWDIYLSEADDEEPFLSILWGPSREEAFTINGIIIRNFTEWNDLPPSLEHLPPEFIEILIAYYNLYCA